MSTLEEMRQRAIDRNTPRSTTRESTKLMNAARRALRAGSPMAAQEIGRAAAAAAINEVRNPVRTDEEAKSLFAEKLAVKRQAGVDIAQKLKEANQYTATGYVKPTASADTQLGKRQQFFNEMVSQARTGTLDTTKSQAEAAKRGLNLTPAEFTTGLSRIATSTGTSPTATGTATASNTSTLNPVAGITPPVKEPRSPTGMLAANDEMKKLRSKTTSMLTTPMLTA